MMTIRRSSLDASRAHEELFSDCRPKELAAIQRLCTAVAVAPGRVLLRQGERGRQFFVVTAGRARAEIGTTFLGEIEAGSFAGEMSLLDGSCCVATVTAVTPMHLLVFGRAEFRALMDMGIPSVTHRMLVTVDRRLRAADARLAA